MEASFRHDAAWKAATITISRGDFEGPEFDVEAVGSIGDPTLERIRAKWLKSYATQYPIELLAYYELQPEAPKALWLPSLHSFVRNNWNAGPFPEGVGVRYRFGKYFVLVRVLEIDGQANSACTRRRCGNLSAVGDAQPLA